MLLVKNGTFAIVLLCAVGQANWPQCCFNRSVACVCRVTFDMKQYMEDCKRLHPNFFPDQSFYPKVDVHFNITPSQVCFVPTSCSIWQLIDRHRGCTCPTFTACMRQWLQVQQHFHIPLTWNPFGYSTYRGS